MKSFGETLVLVMDEKGIKASDLHRATNIPQPYISKLVNNKFGDPSFARACQIIEAIGMTPDEFLALQMHEN